MGSSKCRTAEPTCSCTSRPFNPQARRSARRPADGIRSGGRQEWESGGGKCEAASGRRTRCRIDGARRAAQAHEDHGDTNETPGQSESMQSAQSQAEGKTPTAARASIIRARNILLATQAGRTSTSFSIHCWRRPWRRARRDRAESPRSRRRKRLTRSPKVLAQSHPLAERSELLLCPTQRRLEVLTFRIRF
jgi:hypothetical protein